MTNVRDTANKLFNTAERSNLASTWEEIAKYMDPSRSGGFVGKPAKGSKKTEHLFDSTAPEAARDLASNFHSSLTNPQTRWAMLRFKSSALNENEQASKWLGRVNEILFDHLNESNFTQEIAKAYKSFTTFSNMALLLEGRQSGGRFAGFNFDSLPLEQIAWAENADNRIDEIYRKFKMTGKQLIDKFGKDVIDNFEDGNIGEQIKDNPTREYEVIHGIYPRDPSEVEFNDLGLAAPEKRPYASKYVLNEKSGEDLIEDGFYEFPIFVGRWSVMPEEVYGRGPSDIALPDVKTLNKVKKLSLESAGKSINAPWAIDRRANRNGLDLRPNQVNVINGGRDSVFQLVPQSNIQIDQFTTQDLRSSIQSIFMIDKLVLPPRQNTGEMTAFEVQQRLEQMQRVLGPTLSALNNEFLSPLVVRMYNILLRAGELPRMPRVLRETGLDVNVEFINPLNRAQQLEELNNIRSFISNIAELAQIKPEASMYINTSEVVKKIRSVRQVSPDVTNSEEEVNRILQQQQQQQRRREELEQQEIAADAQSKFSEANQNG